MKLGTCLELRVLLQLDDQILFKLFLLWLMAFRNPKFRAISLSYWIVFPRCIMSYSSKGDIFFSRGCWSIISNSFLSRFSVHWEVLFCQRAGSNTCWDILPSAYTSKSRKIGLVKLFLISYDHHFFSVFGCILDEAPNFTIVFSTRKKF